MKLGEPFRNFMQKFLINIIKGMIKKNLLSLENQTILDRETSFSHLVEDLRMALIGFSTVILLLTAIFLFASKASSSSFSIDYKKNSFKMDGKPFRYVSGSLHYFRIPKEYWRDRLRKIRGAGLNAISTYVEWSQHEAEPGVFNFSEDLDLMRFIEIAREEDLFVILRPGPYICAERDMGGLPYWLLTKNPDVYLRTKDPKYTKYVERWLHELMTRLSPFLYGRGGPIILVQVENEYGSYAACDKEHLIWLRDLFKKYVKDDAVLFTTDGAGKSYLKCGKIPGVYATVDFGPSSDVSKAFRAQREFEPRGPYVNSEYYPGWLTHWGEEMAKVESEEVTRTLTKILDMGANVNFYMFHGGTNFGFTAGANYGSKYLSDITSYDYDAPISEAGDLTPKYYAIKNVVERYLPQVNISVSTSEKGDYGEIELFAMANILSPKVRKLLGKTRQNYFPLPFEQVHQNVGYLLYETILNSSQEQAYLKIRDLRDVANVYLNENLQGYLSREFKKDKIELHNIKQGDKLSIMVENLGRINYGSYLNDTKGIISPVYLGDEAIVNWKMTSFDLKNINLLEDCFSGNSFESCLWNGGYTFYFSSFKIPNREMGEGTQDYPLDSFLDMTPLTKGVVFLNGRNLGRYWSERGPQFSLYVPGVYLKFPPEENLIVIMDEYISAPSIKINFSKKPTFF